MEKVRKWLKKRVHVEVEWKDRRGEVVESNLYDGPGLLKTSRTAG